MTLQECRDTFGNEIIGLLLAAFAADLKWQDTSPIAIAARGEAMKKQMLQGRALLDRIYHATAHKPVEVPNDNTNGAATTQARRGGPIA